MRRLLRPAAPARATRGGGRATPAAGNLARSSASFMTAAFDSPSAITITRSALVSIGSVSVSRRGGGLGASTIGRTSSCSSDRAACPGKSEATCPSGPTPSRTRSRRGALTKHAHELFAVRGRCHTQDPDRRPASGGSTKGSHQTSEATGSQQVRGWSRVRKAAPLARPPRRCACFPVEEHGGQGGEAVHADRSARQRHREELAPGSCVRGLNADIRTPVDRAADLTGPTRMSGRITSPRAAGPPRSSASSRRCLRPMRSASAGPQLPQSYVASGFGAFRTGSTIAQAASTTSCRAKSVASPVIASPSSRSYGPSRVPLTLRVRRHDRQRNGLAIHAFARALGGRADVDGDVRRQREPDVVVPVRRLSKHDRRRFFQVDDDLGRGRLQTLAGAHVEGHTLPSPRIDEEAHRHERGHTESHVATCGSSR